MEQKAFVISRRAYQEDDLEYGTFQICYISLTQERVINIFNNICQSTFRDPDAKNIHEKVLLSLEYDRKGWHYEYKLEIFMLDHFSAQLKNMQ